jgi:hypothetical protein
MNKGSFWFLLLSAIVASGCSFQNKTELLLPTAPSASSASSGGTDIGSSSAAGSGASTGSSSSSGSSSGSTTSPSSSSDFAGTWSSGTLPGLPQISSCTDLHWSISSQTQTSIKGEVSATCGSIADITADLTGELDGTDKINLTAKGSAIALGVTCNFDLTGVGKRESEDSLRLDYQGMTCLGPVKGSELLRRNSPTPATPPIEPPPTPSSPAPPPSSGSVACSGNTGPQIVECVEKQYPSYLAAGVSLQTRASNMQFLRNRIIETAKCKGMDVGLNLKRGGPSISTDFLVWRHGGLTEGVDIGQGYDDTKKKLNLIWHTYGPPNYGHPYYKDYGPVSCN